MWKKDQFDIVAVGDITVDAFIKLKDAKVHCTVDTERCELCVRFGDKVPYESVTIIPAVGNSANAAVSAARLGLRSALLSTLGDDENGSLCIKKLKAEGVSTNYLAVQHGTPTNYHYVLWYEADRTILVKHQDYSYTLPQTFTEPKFVYLSSLGESALSLQNKIAEYLKEHPEVKLAFQPGTFQMKLGFEALRDIYARTEIFFCNKEEAQRITGNATEDLKELLAAVRTLGPKIAVITDGPKGAYASDGSTRLKVPAYPDRKPPLERTGAGDAFASSVVAGLIAGLPLTEALLWGPVNSMSVVEYIGAQEGLLTRPQLNELLLHAPAHFTVEQF
jgi:ribokinase